MREKEKGRIEEERERENERDANGHEDTERARRVDGWTEKRRTEKDGGREGKRWENCSTSGVGGFSGSGGGTTGIKYTR